MSTFKLMSRLWSRNKFYKNLILAVIVLFSGFLLCATIASIRQEAPADTLTYAFCTLFPQYLMVIFFLFFSSFSSFFSLIRFLPLFMFFIPGLHLYEIQATLLYQT